MVEGAEGPAGQPEVGEVVEGSDGQHEPGDGGRPAEALRFQEGLGAEAHVHPRQDSIAARIFDTMSTALGLSNAMSSRISWGYSSKHCSTVSAESMSCPRSPCSNVLATSIE